MFCEKCGSLLVPKEYRGKRSFYCNRCNKYHSFNKKIVEKGEKKKKIVLIKEKRIDLPKIDKRCSKCGGKKAYFWIEQTRASDEPPTRFYKCTKCGKVWREYS
jgi:DNA-directed RNA polymerase subunit M